MALPHRSPVGPEQAPPPREPRALSHAQRVGAHKAQLEALKNEVRLPHTGTERIARLTAVKGKLGTLRAAVETHRQELEEKRLGKTEEEEKAHEELARLHKEIENQETSVDLSLRNKAKRFLDNTKAMPAIEKAAQVVSKIGSTIADVAEVVYQYALRPIMDFLRGIKAKVGPKFAPVLAWVGLDPTLLDNPLDKTIGEQLVKITNALPAGVQLQRETEDGKSLFRLDRAWSGFIGAYPSLAKTMSRDVLVFDALAFAAQPGGPLSGKKSVTLADVAAYLETYVSDSERKKTLEEKEEKAKANPVPASEKKDEKKPEDRA